jgi:hypothetical protein
MINATSLDKILKEKGWLYDADETSCKAYVKGIYDLWYFPDTRYIEIESEEYGYHYKGYIQSDEDLIKALPKEQLYYYAGYDRMHLETGMKNFYYDTKENIINHLKSTSEFKEGTTQEEIDAHIEEWFKCYTTPQ